MVVLQATRPLSASRLAKFRKCETLYLEERGDDSTKTEIIGQAGHALILEGRQVYDSRFTMNGPVNPKTGKVYGLDTKAVFDWEAEHGKTVITDDMGRQVEAMAFSVSMHRRARILLTGGTPESWIDAHYCGIPCCGRLDYDAPMRISDLKTCDDLDSFEHDARRFGYTHQMAFYRSLVSARDNCRPFDIEVFFVAVEKKAPYRCGVWRIGQDILAIAQKENEAAIERLKRCQETNQWRTGYEEVREFDWL